MATSKGSASRSKNLLVCESVTECWWKKTRIAASSSLSLQTG
jgi:hypothetical protein